MNANSIVVLDPHSRASQHMRRKCEHVANNSYGFVQDAGSCIFVHVCKDMLRFKHRTCEALTKEGAKKAFKAGGAISELSRYIEVRRGSPNKDKMRMQQSVKQDTYLDEVSTSGNEEVPLDTHLSTPCVGDDGAECTEFELRPPDAASLVEPDATVAVAVSAPEAVVASGPAAASFIKDGRHMRTEFPNWWSPKAPWSQPEQAVVATAVLILVVDDDRTCRRIMTWKLKQIRTNCVVHEAETAAQALRMTLAVNYDIILMDENMPVYVGKPILGSDAIAEIRRTEAAALVADAPRRAYIISCSSDESGRARARRQGADCAWDKRLLNEGRMRAAFAASSAA